MLATSAYLVDHVLLPVSHRHFVMALPKLVRPTVRRRRGLLKRLCTIVQKTITDLYCTALNLPKGQPTFFLRHRCFFH